MPTKNLLVRSNRRDSSQRVTRLRAPLTGKRAALSLVLAALVVLAAGPALAQGGAATDSVAQDAVDAAAQPLTDLNLRRREIPPILQMAQNSPYDLVGIENCAQVATQIGYLEEALGPDADVPPESEGLANRGLQLGGELLGGLIPFRGLVRQISGANAEEGRWEAATYAGVARRSFLKGYSRGLNCSTSTAEAVIQTPEEAGIESAEDVLGLGSAPTESVASPEVPENTDAKRRKATKS